MHRLEKLRLYKNILYCAYRFPSIKRAKIVEEIKLGFRQNKVVEDPAELSKLLAVAVDGLNKLSMYTSLPKDAFSWTVDMDRQPMPDTKK
mmetsp:Transcript_70190/g.137862  ORF Transcript_70190/g.137862 Transcript_70190/m.137862 type:complete len:90 (-) Transcript_70190:52-321(-)